MFSVISWILPAILFAAIFKLTKKTAAQPKQPLPFPLLLTIPLVSLLAGIASQKIVFCFAPVFLIPIIFILATSVFVLKKYLLFFISLSLLFFFSGALLLHAQLQNHDARTKSWARKNVTLIASILDKTEKSRDFYKEVLLVSARELWTEVNEKIDISGKICCFLRKQTDLTPGQIIKLENISLQSPPAPQTNSSSFADYLVKENIAATTFIHKTNYKILNKDSSNLSMWLARFRWNLFSRLKNKLAESSFSYFSPIFLGKPQELSSKETKPLFLLWGISHHLARSGLHIVFFILMWLYLFRLIPVGFMTKHLLLLLLTLVYAALSWTSIAFIRALSLFLLYEAGFLLSKQTTILHLFLLVTYGVIFWNPMQLFFLDFQLSFGITYALCLTSYRKSLAPQPHT
ncbi:ComEC/Rec2 family competence protein [Candidatus Babeliales bacterium]|nr:ComEC/Rec2 family competence protein [Candidatus Babeliales bacterium]